MQKTKYYSYKIGTLARGCQLCVKGSKSVLFITGLCTKHCYFCPISEKKYQKDVIYINEMPAKGIKDAIKEIKLCSSRGVGITGGDPLIKTERTVFFIKRLKKTFGKKFHIHLYAPLVLVNKSRLKKLNKAGLDEIRFHPDLDDSELWGRISLALGFKWEVGIEIPVIPKKEKHIKRLVLFINNLNKNSKNKIKVLNLNELEYSDTNASQLEEKGFKTKNRQSYGIKGSEELAFRILKFIEKNKIKLNTHYCTTTLKDRVQLASRIKRRAKNIKKDYDVMTDEGILVRGVIYSKNLTKTYKEIKNKFKIPRKLIEIDQAHKRILIAPWILGEISKNIKNKCFIAHEYPTYDALPVLVEPI